MKWTELLESEIEAAYRTVDKLMDLVDPASLGWKPSTGQNWMTMGQLLRHICGACGPETKGFVAGDWGPPANAGDPPLPPAEKMPTVSSVAEAKRMLEADRAIALDLIWKAGEKRLDQDPAPAPWDPTQMPLGRRLLEVVRHLDIHRCQLFYYLKRRANRCTPGISGGCKVRAGPSFTPRGTPRGTFVERSRKKLTSCRRGTHQMLRGGIEMALKRMVIVTGLLAFVAFTGFAADTWYITTVAGTGKAGYSGDGGPATEAMLNFFTWDLCVDASGCLYLADGNSHRIRKIDTRGMISTVAGNGVAGYSGDGGPAIVASLNSPGGVDIDQAGNLYIGDMGNHRIRRVDTSGIITTLAGNGKEGYSGDGGPAEEAELKLAWPRVDHDGNLFIFQFKNHVIRKLDRVSGIITTVAGTGTRGASGDGGPAIRASLSYPDDAFINRLGNLFICDTGNNSIRRIDLNGIITTVVGGGLGEDGSPATKAYLTKPGGVCVDADGKQYIADTLSHRIRMVDTSGAITTIAGIRSMGYTGDGGLAIEARLSQPKGMRVAVDGSMYFIDWGNQVVRKLYRK